LLAQAARMCHTLGSRHYLSVSFCRPSDQIEILTMCPRHNLESSFDALIMGFVSAIAAYRALLEA
jgi:hypothetical protein